MESKTMLLKLMRAWILPVLFYRSLATSGVDHKYQEECANEATGLAICLPYVSGEAKAPPTKDCCTGLDQAIHKSLRCICLLVQERNDSSLGHKINATLALSLPALCHDPANVSDCTRLLHLPPGSPDAKLFDDFANNGTAGVMSSRARRRGASNNGTETNSAPKSGGGFSRPEIALLWLSLPVVAAAMVHHLLYVS